MKQSRTHIALLVLAAGIAFTMPAVAETYKWTDAEGRVHYSDQPPPSNVKNPTTVTPRKKSSRSAPPQEGETQSGDAKPAPAAAAKTTQELDAEFRQRQVEAAEKEAEQKRAAQEAESKKRNCDQAKANVARLKSGGRVARTNDKGETEYLDDAQIAQELARANEIADSWCK